jgi:uncharacterized protein
MNIFSFIKNEKTRELFNIIFELIIIGLLGIVLLWISNNIIIHNPSKPAFRIIGTIVQLVILLLFLFIKSPSVNEIGLSWKNINPKYKIYYIIGIAFIPLLIISGCFFMSFFAFTMNLRFGIMAALFEEIIFRGYIWHRLQDKKFDDITLIFTTAIFFGLFHLTYYYEIGYATSFFKDAPSLSSILRQKVMANLGYGLFLGFFRYKSKNLYLPLVIHSIGNIMGQ